MQAQSFVPVEFSSVTGVLGAGEEDAVDFGLEDGGDVITGGVVKVVVEFACGVVEVVVVDVGDCRVTNTRGVVTLVPPFDFGVARFVGGETEVVGVVAGTVAERVSVPAFVGAS